MFFTDPMFAVPKLSPDGERLAYLAPAGGRLNVWVRGVGQTHDEAVQVTADTRRAPTMMIAERAADLVAGRSRTVGEPR